MLNKIAKFSSITLVLCVMFVIPVRAAVEVGDPAPGFSVKSLEGKIFSLEELKKTGPVLLVFWATECVYCYAHVSDLKALQNKYRNHELTIAAINIGGEYDMEVEQYAKDNELNYLLLSDRLNNLDVAEAYKVIGTPTLILVSHQGKVLYRGHDIPDMEKWIK